MSSPGLSDLRKLANIINDSVDRIEKALEARSMDFPSINSLYNEKEEVVRSLPEVSQSIVAIIAASEQLAMTARSPSSSLLDISKKVRALYIPVLRAYLTLNLYSFNYVAH